jgi:hypothetical protein
MDQNEAASASKEEEPVAIFAQGNEDDIIFG